MKLLKKAQIVLFFFVTICVKQTEAQVELLDSLTLDTLTAYTSLEEALKNPDAVIKLELRRKKLKSFPKEILNFKNLQYLDLSKNSVRELPMEIEQLTNLQYLSLSKNKLTNVPHQIGMLVNLYYLNLNQNDISILPPTIGNLTKLKTLDLWSNEIDKFPSEMKNLKSLQVIDLRVILITDAEQVRLQGLLPETKIFFSPYCKCQQ